MARSQSQSSNPKVKRKDLQRRIAELEIANRELDGTSSPHLTPYRAALTIWLRGEDTCPQRPSRDAAAA
jgi:hypothetical protein